MCKLILSLDGGGIKGAATTEFLRNLELAMGKSIYDTFDMFVGTSTGAIIAAALGVLKMNGESLAQLYNYKNSNTIMDKSHWDKRFGFIQNKPKYNGKGKRKILKQYFGNILLNSAEKPTIVITYDIESRVSAVLKSTSLKEISTLDAVDASSAAPCYFPTVNIGDRWLIDGGVVANNPTMCAFVEAKKTWPNETIKILSIGTGNNIRKIDGKKSQKFGAVGWMSHDLLGVVMDESIVDYQAKSILGENYLRVNSNLEYVNDDMDDCSHRNIKNLKRLGKEWFDNFGTDAIRLIEKTC